MAAQVAPVKRDRDLMSWWKRFQSRAKKEEEKEQPPTGIFGVPLQDSIKYANVAISLTDAEGKSFIYGYVPIVIAKCGVYLKEKATDIEGIFRLSGSAKRIKDLQTIFDSPDRYGKGLDWTGYTVHDAANILRRYLNQLPEPIVPLEFYDRFRDPLRHHEMQAVGDLEGQDQGDFDAEGAIKTYQKLITELPPLNRQLLLYILDLLAVFASKSDENRMTATNLAAIFQPGMISHPTHDMSPGEYRLSQDVLVFLIENQDHFLIGMRGTAADEATVREVQRGSISGPVSPATPSSDRNRTVTGVGRTASGASAGADSVRRFGGIRRNVSASSRHSKDASNVPSPVSPINQSPITIGVHRSNTVPSNKSPAIPASRFSKASEVTTSSSPKVVTTVAEVITPIIRAPTSDPGSVELAGSTEKTNQLQGVDSISAASVNTTNPDDESVSNTTTAERPLSNESLLLDRPAPPFANSTSTSSTPTKDRGFSSFFARSPTSDTERREGRAPNKLRKKRMPGSSNHSAQSSTHSLNGS